MRFIDVHCHIHREEFKEDLDEVIVRAKRNGVIAIITSSISIAGFYRALNLIEKYKGYIYLSAGLDPRIVDLKTVHKMMDLCIEYMDKIIAIGEVGLDYWWIKEHSLRERQREIFVKWIKLTRQLDLPLVIHSRSAGKYAIEILIKNSADRVLMHAFDGKPVYAKRGVVNGYFFSIPTSICRSRQKQKLVKNLSLENILLETDSPVLSPIKNARNEPANIIYAARKIAEIKSIDLNYLSQITLKNTKRLFNI